MQEDGTKKFKPPPANQEHGNERGCGRVVTPRKNQKITTPPRPQTRNAYRCRTCRPLIIFQNYLELL